MTLNEVPKEQSILREKKYDKKNPIQIKSCEKRKEWESR